MIYILNYSLLIKNIYSMRSIFLLFLVTFCSFSFSQSLVHLKSEFVSESVDTLKLNTIIWKLDWENKIVYDHPIYVDIVDNISSISFYPGDYAIEYRVDDRVYAIYNIHIYSNTLYYRYFIYSGYLENNFDLIIKDRLIIRSVYIGF
jgi:hypothetical protein